MMAFRATMIYGRRSGLSMVMLMWRLFNLLWRPYINISALALQFSSMHPNFPSGRFPGDGGECRRQGLFRFCGEEGMDSIVFLVLTLGSYV